MKPAVVHGAMGYGQKSFKPLWRCYQFLSGFLAKGHLPLLGFNIITHNFRACLEIQGSRVQTRLGSIDFFQDVKILSTSPPGGT